MFRKCDHSVFDELNYRKAGLMKQRLLQSEVNKVIDNKDVNFITSFFGITE